MTALDKYDTLEANAQFRRALDAPLKKVTISLGKRCLMIYGGSNQTEPLHQWELGAVIRRNQDPILGVCFHLGTMRDEELWIEYENADIIQALDDLSEALFIPELKKRRSYGRTIGWVLFALILIAGFWGVPRGYERILSDMLSNEMRLSISKAVFATFVKDDRFCSSITARQILDRYASGLDQNQLEIWIGSDQKNPIAISAYGLIVPDDALKQDNIDQFERDIQSSRLFLERNDPIKSALQAMPLMVQLKFMYSAQLPASALADFKHALLSQPQGRLDQSSGIPPLPVGMGDADWLRLRNACR